MAWHWNSGGETETEAGRWLSLVAAMWVQAVSGNNYTFANYSAPLKSLMGLSQLQLNNLSVAKDVGKAFGLLAGLASDKLPVSLILAIGSLEGLVGYGVQYLVVSRSINPLPYWQMCVFLCMGGNSTTWMNTAVLVTSIRNFRRNRGPVSGVLKGYVGLSTAIFTDICAALFADDPSRFLLMLAVVPAAVCSIAMLFLREYPDIPSAGGKVESRRFAAVKSVAVVIAVYLLVFDVTGDHGRLLSQVFAAGLLFLLAAPLAIPLYIASTSSSKTSGEGEISEPLLHECKIEIKKDKAGDELDEEPGKKQRPKVGEDHTVMEALKTMDFWVLFVSFLCGVGTGQAVMNNMGQLGIAMGYKEVSIFVSLMSIWGFFGRIGSGTISEYYIKKHAIPRPLWNAISQIIMAGGCIVMAIGLPGSLYTGSIIVGLCYGVRLAVTVPTASELFGLKYYGLIYNILILNLPLGSFFFSGLLAGLIYDAQAVKSDSGSNTCIGAHCYRLVFVIMAFACIVGFALDLLLAFRTREVYGKIRSSKKTHKVKQQTTIP